MARKHIKIGKQISDYYAYIEEYGDFILLLNHVTKYILPILLSVDWSFTLQCPCEEVLPRFFFGHGEKIYNMRSHILP